MMAFFLGNRADEIAKIQRLDKIGKSKDSFQSLDSIALNQGPFGNQQLEFDNLRFNDSRRIASTGGALFVFQRFHSRLVLAGAFTRSEPEYQTNIACFGKQTKRIEQSESGAVIDCSSATNSEANP
jgi:hypothetical protein